MKQFAKRSLAMLLALVMSIGLLAGLTFEAGAVTDKNQYVTGSASGYTNVIANWGERGETATYLSPNAEEFYEDNDVTYAELAALNGSFDLDNVTSSEMYTALHNLMESNHAEQTSYGDTRYLYAYTDCQNSDTSKVTCFYSGTVFSSTWDPDSTWNREHTWPKSKTDWVDKLDKSVSNSTKGDVADLMMLRPVSANLNSGRGNKAYGESSGFYYPNTSSSQYDVRGDVARTMLYVYVRWGNEDYMWGTDGVMENLDVLLKWVEEDPVDTWELGRNDSVESVTGTRNVFVDYPELAFLLFNEEIPEDLITPSDEEHSDFVITAVAGEHGNVQLDGNIITAIPDAGYKAAGYTVTSGEAVVSQNGNVFTVRAKSDCTITITFATKGNFKVSMVENGDAVSQVSVQEGGNVVLPAAQNVPANHTFVGWSEVQIDDVTEITGVYAAGAEYVPANDVVLYAVYAYEVAETVTQYVLVTDANTLAAGDKVIIAASNAAYAMGAQSGNYRSLATITKSGNVATFGSDVQILTLETGTVSGTFAFNTGSGYLAAVSSSSNNLKTNPSKNANSSFKIEIKGGTTTVKAQGSYTRNMILYNSQSPRFSCYKATSSNVHNVCLYKEATVEGASVIHYTTGTAFTCDHSTAEVFEEVAATCKSAGLAAHSYCSICDIYLVNGVEVAYSTLVIAVDADNHVGDTYQEGYREAACDAPGYSGDTHCADCDALLESGAVVTVQHTLTHFEGMAATCISTGTKAHDHCSVCNGYFVDGVKVEERDLILPIDENNHAGQIHVEGAEPENCGKDGYTGNTVCECGKVVENGETIPAHGNHGETELRGAEEATTEKEGYTGDIHCTVCGELLEKGEVIPKKEVEQPEEEKPEEEKPEEEKPEEEKPEEEKPEEEKPEEEKPEEEKPEEEKPEVEEPEVEKPEEDIPQTGEEFHLMVIALLVLSLCGVATMYVSARKRKF